jgi:hypothetical protein
MKADKKQQETTAKKWIFIQHTAGRDGFEEQSRLRDDVLDVMEQYANQRVIEELERIPNLKTPLGEEIRLSYHYVLKRIKELKQ